MSFNPTSGYNPPDDDPASRMPRPYRRLLLAATEDDAYGWLRRHPARAMGSEVAAVVWPGRFRTLEGGPSFDRMAVTAAAFTMSAAIAACLTRVKGSDGLTPGQRITADEIGARLRETT